MASAINAHGLASWSLLIASSVDVGQHFLRGSEISNQVSRRRASSLHLPHVSNGQRKCHRPSPFASSLLYSPCLADCRRYTLFDRIER